MVRVGDLCVMQPTRVSKQSETHLVNWMWWKGIKYMRGDNKSARTAKSASSWTPHLSKRMGKLGAAFITYPCELHTVSGVVDMIFWKMETNVQNQRELLSVRWCLQFSLFLLPDLCMLQWNQKWHLGRFFLCMFVSDLSKFFCMPAFSKNFKR